MQTQLRSFGNLPIMFGGLRKQVDDHFFGYREVRLPNPNEFELPNPYLIRYLTTGNKQKALSHFKEITIKRDQLLDLAVYHAEKRPLEELSASTKTQLVRFLNPTGIAEVEKFELEVVKAISIAGYIAIQDVDRRGENPPVAKGIDIDAVSNISERFDENCRGVASIACKLAFYLARRSTSRPPR